MLIENEPMAKHCSLRAGGAAQQFFSPQTVSELANFLKTNSLPILMLGLGSNLLVRDQGFHGVVITLKRLNALTINATVIDTQAGTTLAKLSRFCQSQGLYGGEFLSAIPGNVGGGLAMNAGAFGAEIWQFVDSVTTINASGILHKRRIEDFKIAYRQVIANHNCEYFIGAKFQFSQPHQQHDIKTLLKQRRASQPMGQANCGSVFKNPNHTAAAQLIEDCQLKGFCIGGACVSNKHANFIKNQHNASATDIENLINHIQQAVKSRFNIHLETEVKIV